MPKILVAYPNNAVTLEVIESASNLLSQLEEKQFITVTTKDGDRPQHFNRSLILKVEEDPKGTETAESKK